MKELDLIRLFPSKRLAVIFKVTKKDIKNGINATKEGFYAFRSCYHENKNPTKRASMGKIEFPIGFKVGRATTNSYLRKQLS